MLSALDDRKNMDGLASLTPTRLLSQQLHRYNFLLRTTELKPYGTLEKHILFFPKRLLYLL